MLKTDSLLTTNLTTKVHEWFHMVIFFYQFYVFVSSEHFITVLTSGSCSNLTCSFYFR